jgi:ribonuclease HI
MKTLSIKDKDIIIFTDGSSRGNPGRGGYGVVAIYPNAHGEMMVDELGGREDLTTNNKMELQAVIEGIKNFVGYYSDLELQEHTFNFYVDSKYVLQGATQWIHGWKKNNWITAGKEEVKNKEEWQELDALMNGVPASGQSGPGTGVGSSRGLKTKWNLIEGHAGVFGNERCDAIATAFADASGTSDEARKNIKLFTGTLADYQASDIGVDILNLDAVNQGAKDKLKARKKSSSSGKPAYSYVSAIDGDVRTHATWAECEARVKGKSGARFKKSTSRENEHEIKTEFSR